MDNVVEITNIGETFERVAARRPDKTAVVYLGTRFSYGHISRLSDRFAAGLQRWGIGESSRIVLYLPNSIHWLIAWLGAMKTGAVTIPITPIYTPLDLEYVANDTQAEVIVSTDRNYGYVARVMERTKVKKVIVANMSDLLPAAKRVFGWLFDKVPKGKVARNDFTWRLPRFLVEASERPAAVAVAPDRTAEIIYTGGTTKHPKGVPITHRLVLNCSHEQISVCRPLFPLEENVILGSAPLFHILGQATFLGTVLLHGGTIILQPRVNIDAMLDAVQREKVKTLIGVPTLYHMILEHDRLDQYDLNSLVYCFSGGDVMPMEVQERWRTRFGRPIYIGYGASETVGGVSMSPPGLDIPPGSMGRVLASKEIRLVDPVDLKPVPEGEPGELLVHSEPMVGSYWNKPEETAKAFVELDGRVFYRTADIVRMDEEKYLYFVDRTVDAIKHKGYRVSASEIESVLLDHPAVMASCVIGLPDEKVGERIKAFVVLKKDIRGVTGYDLITFCRGRLTSYKVPQYIEFRDMLPKSKVGKLLRRELRQEEISRRKQ
ncbi:MAG: AMP-binding protein [Thermodesulfobacteriota bacterium]